MMDFAGLGLNPSLIRAIEEMGFDAPMPVQEKTIPQVLNNHSDLIALAMTGTGKTAAFGLPLLQKTDSANKKTQVLILCPTRELCIQITDEISRYAKYIRGMQILAVYGGASMEHQIRTLKSGVQIIVATPGRMVDLLNRGMTDISHIHSVVLDEADEMLNMGFQEDLNTILSKTPSEKQTLLFSATMPREVEAIAAQYMNDPVEISIGKRNAGAANVSHWYYIVQAHDRYLALKRIVDYIPEIYGIIFCRTRQETRDIAAKLVKDGYNADALHGELSQAQREYVMQRFRTKQLHMLVATDVAARGLDVNDLTHIINYNLPDEKGVYTHRSGRTGRAGKEGISISIILSRDVRILESYERTLNKKFENKKIPTGKEICQKQLLHIIGRIEQVDMQEFDIDMFMPAIHKKLEGMDKEEIIKRFLSLEFNRFMEYYSKMPDLKTTSADRGSYRGSDRPSESRDHRGRDRGTERGRERGNDRNSDRHERQFGRERRPERSETYSSERAPRQRIRDNDRSDRREISGGNDKNLERFSINLGSTQGIKVHNLLGIINDCTGNRDMAIKNIKITPSTSYFEVAKNYHDNLIESFEDIQLGSRRLKVKPSMNMLEAKGK